jgi:hypothetical protein
VPFILKEILRGVPNDPLELTLSVKQAAIDFNKSHLTSPGLENVNATTQAKRFAV